MHGAVHPVGAFLYTINIFPALLAHANHSITIICAMMTRRNMQSG